MQEKLRKFGLPVYGRKLDLINRLQKRSEFLRANGITKELRIVLNRCDLSISTSLSTPKLTKKRHDTPAIRMLRPKTHRIDTSQVIAQQSTSTSSNTRSDDMPPQYVLRSGVRKNTEPNVKTTSTSTSSSTPKLSKKRYDDTSAVRTLGPKIRRIDTEATPTPLHPINKLQKKKEKTLRQNRKVVANIMTLKPALEKYEIVWAHIRGYALWPGIIEELCANGKYKIHFFGDYSISYVTKYKIVHYMEGFSSYSNYTKTNLLLHKAVRETQIFLFEREIPKCCYICKVLDMRRNI